MRKRALEKSREALQPRPADTDVFATWLSDRSLWSLLAANLLTLFIALAGDWTLHSVLFVYWGQSIIIGIANAVRMVSLDNFSTKGFMVNGRQADATVGTKWRTALFFSLHYGLFHIFYLVFLVAQIVEQEQNAALLQPMEQVPVFTFAYLLAMAAFAVNHFFSLRYNIEVDRRGMPNLGTLMMTPYLRVVPMHLIIVFGATMEYSRAALILFIGMKALADALMHMIEHHYLSRMSSGQH